jgi:hypothetical protein
MNPIECPDDDDGVRERVGYFSGQLLDVDDLRREQDYFLAKARRHNRMLHGWGVVSGLEVSVEVSVDGATHLVVEPGYALDACGNEIVVPTPVVVDVPDDRGTVVAVRFKDAVVGAGRVRDSFAVQLIDDRGEPWVVLATLTSDDTGTCDDAGTRDDASAWAVDCSVRRPLGLD